ncbi:2Fe-2S iron-sulfur cluster-binding protein [Mycolicibacterium parafortuitum]|uniref:Reductase [Rhodococcus jostii RHA1] n=1 Tax=Mycolicibacterium parafortuitum TaxID=39692 RepID=A0A375YI36_MYCPF|nr:2Fe-2S iron-sulfur cluster binding domain-containing protein [Mycolicibacterium parafortuitum]ORB24999.1 ferredoxin [Mycolicibacterium parafortuitum]SRX80792.1 reductase [Rhodococcus jostii RHA1] [Mycolicibacterium parafortuitum]
MSSAEPLRDAATVRIDLDGAVHRLSWPQDKTLVEIMLDAGIDVPYSCQEGRCGSCVVTVTGGQVSMDSCEILDESDLADGLVLGCQARPVSEDISVEY